MSVRADVIEGVQAIDVAIAMVAKLLTILFVPALYATWLLADAGQQS